MQLCWLWGPSSTWAASGWGADQLLMQITGVDEKTIRRARAELPHGPKGFRCRDRRTPHRAPSARPQVELHDSTPYFVLHFNMTPGSYSIYGTVVRTFELALAFQYPVHHRSRGQSNVANVDVVLACSLRVKRRAVIERALVNHRI